METTSTQQSPTGTGREHPGGDRGLSLFEKLVCVPTGFLWLLLLGLLAILLMVYMTALYYVHRAYHRLAPPRRRRRGRGEASEEPIA